MTPAYESRIDIGLRRQRQEDALLVDPASGVYAVADGMGGHEDGDKASSMAIEVLRAGAGMHDLPILFQAADQLLFRRWPKVRREQKRPGTTLVAVRVDGREVRWAGVGDSRIYRWSEGVLTQLTVDDTIGARNPQVLNPFIAGILTQAIGGHYDEEVGLKVQDGLVLVRPGDRVLLCSDGLHGQVEDAYLSEVFARGEDLGPSADAFLQLAMRAGAPDNVSLILLGW